MGLGCGQHMWGPGQACHPLALSSGTSLAFCARFCAVSMTESPHLTFLEQEAGRACVFRRAFCFPSRGLWGLAGDYAHVSCINSQNSLKADEHHREWAGPSLAPVSVLFFGLQSPHRWQSSWRC